MSREVDIDSPEEGESVGRAWLVGLTSLRLSPKRYGKRVRAALGERSGDRLTWHQF